MNRFLVELAVLAERFDIRLLAELPRRRENPCFMKNGSNVDGAGLDFIAHKNCVAES